jgi:hypothetical protein
MCRPLFMQVGDRRERAVVEMDFAYRLHYTLNKFSGTVQFALWLLLQIASAQNAQSTK